MPDIRKIDEHGAMNVDFSEIYDQENDTYYVTFKTGEPSYCVEVDDVLLIEVGLFTNIPTGFRILNFAKNDVKRVDIGVLIRNVEDSLKTLSPPSSDARKIKVEQALEKVFA